MSELREVLKEKRPNLSDSSLTTYCSILKNLYKKIWGGNDEINLKNFDKTEHVLDF